MDKYSLVYIDDTPDEQLTKYLDQNFHPNQYEVSSSEIIFHPENGYTSLLEDTKVKGANIILIDSKLFENRTAPHGKFTGEEFKLILKKLFPFIEVIVITQNEIDTEIDKIPKYIFNHRKTAIEYYSELLPPKIDVAVTHIRQYRLLADIVNRNDSWEEVLKNKVLSTLNGSNVYDNLSKTDIDELITAFKEIEDKLNG